MVTSATFAASTRGSNGGAGYVEDRSRSSWRGPAEEFLDPMGVTQHRLAVSIVVPPRRINEIVHGKRRITADTALRLSRHFGTSDRFWLNLQTRFDLETEKDKLGTALDDMRPLRSA
ncbi:MAG: HigA family addiction module antitoxin [Jiangellales bacterium]